MATNKEALLSGYRPEADATIKSNLSNEWGTPNHQGVDNHDTLTGSTTQGRFSGSKANTSLLLRTLREHPYPARTQRVKSSLPLPALLRGENGI